MDQTYTPTEIKLGELFAQNLKECLSADDLAEVRKRNSAETDKRICHSHDFCDANEPMSEAFKTVTSNDIDGEDEASCELWSTAWDYAATKYLGRDGGPQS